MRKYVPGRVCALACACALTCLAGTATAQPPAFEVLPDSGGFFATPRKVSGTGGVIAGDFVLGQFGPTVAGRWVYPGPVVGQLGLVGGQSTGVDCLSRDGNTVFGSSASGGFRWTSPGPIVSDPFGRTVDITPDGTVRIVANQRQVGNSTPQDLFAPVDFQSARLNAIDASGGVIIGTGVRVVPGRGYGGGDIEVQEAVRWDTVGGWQRLGFLPGDASSTGLLISDDGAVTMGESRADEQGPSRVWRASGGGSMSDLGTLPGLEGLSVSPVDMSADGQVVVGTVDSFPARHFVWTPGSGMQDLVQVLTASGQDLEGVDILSVRGLSADGQVVVGSCVVDGQLRGFASPLFGSCAPPPGGAADSIGEVARVGQGVPGEPATLITQLAGFPIPNVGGGAGTAYFAQLTGGSTGFFVGSSSPVARVGGSAPGGGSFLSMQSGIIKRGNAMLRGAAGSGASVGDGIWLHTGGVLTQVVRTGAPLFGLTVDALLSEPKLNNAGAVAFIASFQSGFTFVSGTPGALSRYPVSAGTASMFPADVVFTTPTLSALNDVGQIALTEQISYVGVPADADSCVMVRSLGQTSNQIVALEGAQAPDMASGVRFGDLLNAGVSLNNFGAVAFRCVLSSGGTGLFSNAGGSMRLIAHTGTQVPGEAPGVQFISLDRCVLNDRGTVAFRAVFAGPGADGVEAVCVKPLGGALSVVARTDVDAPGLSSCRRIQTIGTGIVLNRAGQVLVPVTLRAGGGVFQRPAVFLHDPVKGLVLIAAHGETVSFGPGDDRVLQNIGVTGTPAVATVGGAPSPLDDTGTVAFLADVQDEPRALFRARVVPPPPPCGGADFNGDGVVSTPDLTFFLARFGQVATPGSLAEMADFNASGLVDTPDLTFFIARFGSVCP